MSKELREIKPLEKLSFEIIKLPDNYTVSLVQSPSTGSNTGQVPKDGSTNLYVLSNNSVESANLDSTGVFKVPYPPELNALIKSKIPIVLKPLSNASNAHVSVPTPKSRKRKVISPVVQTTRREKRKEEKAEGNMASAESAQDSTARRRKSSSEESGLRYFAAKVSDKVREKKLTTYNIVAEELADSCTATQTNSIERMKEKKNIRRRVYDALNVLMSVGVIRKEGDNVAWSGTPRTLAEAISPQDVREGLAQQKRKVIRQLRQRVYNSSLQYLALQELAEINKKRDRERPKEKPTEESLKGKSVDEVRKICSIASIIAESEYDETQRIQLPFIFLTCRQTTQVEVSVGKGSLEHEVAFGEPFSIVEDTEVLRRTPLVRAIDSGEYTEEQLLSAVRYMPAFVNLKFSELVKMHRNRLRHEAETKKRKDIEAQLAASLKAVPTFHTHVVKKGFPSVAPPKQSPNLFKINFVRALPSTVVSKDKKC